MFRLIPIVLLTSLLMVLGLGCGDTPDVQVSVSSSAADESSLTIVRINADLLRKKPTDPMDKPIALMMINQGDQITILEGGMEWRRVQHILTGKIGWLHKSFIQRENRSKWWSGDTDRSRKMAELLYKDKIFLEKGWPIIHINIEERWNKLVFTVKDNGDFPKDQAIQCCEFAIDKLVSYFPDWRDHQVFLESTWDEKPYTLVMADDKNCTYF